jgi:hypothetical protein
LQRIACLIAVGLASLLFASAASAKVSLVRLTSPVAPGSAATLTAIVSPRSVRCSITVLYKSGPSHAAGLSSKKPDKRGRVSWTWTVGASTSAGRFSVVVDCERAGTLEVFLTVAGKKPLAPRIAAAALGKSVALRRRTRSQGCNQGPLPDRRCSPGAYYTGLTTGVICSSSFSTSLVRNVSTATKRRVEVEYGLAPRSYGVALEIDHIVPLELGGSNAIANLYPEKLDARPGYRTKDKLENKLHQLVCAGKMRQPAAQQQIAANWRLLYHRVFGRVP